MRIAVLSNTAWSLVNFRAGLINRLIADGNHIVAIAPIDEYSSQLEALGVEYQSIKIDNKGKNPVRDLGLIFNLAGVLHRKKIDLAILYTIKPVIYGSLACSILKIPVINVITGLGTAFLSDGVLTRVVESLYRIALKRVYWTFFLNDDDRSLFLARGLVQENMSSRIPGEGVNLINFSPRSQTTEKHGTHFLFAGRMLRDKGLVEFVEAARSVGARYPTTRFSLLGFVGVANQSAIGIDQLNAWVQEGVVCYLGSTNDVRSHVASADCFVLPSYREGISRALLEAMAMARPVIATDVVGCRELVDQGGNGLLCAPRDVKSLIDAMEKFIKMDEHSRTEMGLHGLAKVTREYGEAVVIEKYLEKISALQSAREKDW